MTVTYTTNDSFMHLLFRWKGSIWKLLWKKFIIFLLLHYSVYCFYRFGLPEYNQEQFKKIALLFDDLTKRIPIEFILGFYVTSVFQRWWEQATSLGWPDKFMSQVVANIRGNSEQVVVIRRTFARLCNLFFVCNWKGLSLKIKRRFPTDQHLVKGGLMTPKEFEQWECVDDKYGRSFLPYYWMLNLLGDLKERSLLSNESMLEMLNDLSNFKSAMGTCTLYNWIDIPLVYTQVVTLATYGYFFFCIVGRQALMSDNATASPVDLYFPVFTTLEFFFYVGWLTVGESLKFAFGEDDDDFDMNYILDRNVCMSFWYADKLYKQSADLVQDYFLGQDVPVLSHTKGSYRHRDQPPGGKLDKIRLNPEDTVTVNEFGKPIDDIPLVAHRRFSLPCISTKLKNIDTQLQKKIVSPGLHGMKKTATTPPTLVDNRLKSSGLKENNGRLPVIGYANSKMHGGGGQRFMEENTCHDPHQMVDNGNVTV